MARIIDHVTSPSSQVTQQWDTAPLLLVHCTYQYDYRAIISYPFHLPLFTSYQDQKSRAGKSSYRLVNFRFAQKDSPARKWNICNRVRRVGRVGSCFTFWEMWNRRPRRWWIWTRKGEIDRQDACGQNGRSLETFWPRLRELDGVFYWTCSFLEKCLESPKMMSEPNEQNWRVSEACHQPLKPSY